MIIFVGFRVDVQSQGKLLVPGQARTLVIAGQCLLAVAFTSLGRNALDFLLQVLAVAGNEYLIRAWFVLTTRGRRMALLLARMTASLLGLATSLLAELADILTFSTAVAWFSTKVRTASQLLAAYFSTADVCKPAWLVL